MYIVLRIHWLWPPLMPIREECYTELHQKWTYTQISVFQRSQTQGTNDAVGQVPTVKEGVIEAYPIPTRTLNSGRDTLSLDTINSRLVELLLLFRRCREFVSLGNCLKLQNSPLSTVVWTSWHVTKLAVPSPIERDIHKDYYMQCQHTLLKWHPVYSCSLR